MRRWFHFFRVSIANASTVGCGAFYCVGFGKEIGGVVDGSEICPVDKVGASGTC